MMTLEKPDVLNRAREKGRVRSTNSAIPGSIIAGSIIAGWLLHDILLVIASSEPRLVFRLIPGSIAAIAAGAALGWILGGKSRVPLALAYVAATGFVLATTLLPLQFDPARVGLAKTLLVQLVLYSVVSLLSGGRIRALAVGLGAAAMVSTRHLDLQYLGTKFVVSEAFLLLFSILLIWSSLQREKRARWTWVGVLFATCVVFTSVIGRSESELKRPDQPELGNIQPRLAKQAPNLILVVLDTVRADHLPAYGYQRTTTPHLEMAQQVDFRVYDEARSTSSWTLPSHGSLLTGLMPSDHGAAHARRPTDSQDSIALGVSAVTTLNDDVPTLAEELSLRGYRTGAIVANDTVLSHEFGLDRGFQHYDDRHTASLPCRGAFLQQLGVEPQIGCLPYRDAEAITDLAASWIDSGAPDKPFFLFLNYMDAHFPYFPPRPFSRAFAADRPVDPLRTPPELMSVQYDRELLYLDHELDRLMSWLKRSGLWENTVIVVTSDHGEAFGEHGHWGHCQYLYEELIRVPLLIKGAGVSHSSRIGGRPIAGNMVHDLMLGELGLSVAPAQETDLMLVAEWYCSEELGPEAYCKSRNLLAWMNGSKKVIVENTGDVEVYDLGADGGELRNLAGPSQLVEETSRRSDEHWSKPLDAATTPDLSKETLEALKAMGYIR